MKYFVIPILLFTLTALNFFSENFKYPNPSDSYSLLKNPDKLSSEKNIHLENAAVYNCNLNFIPNKNIISVKSKIVWKNNTLFPAKKIYFNFKRNYKETDNGIIVTQFLCSKKSSKPMFDKNRSKTTKGYWIRVDFENPILKGDSVTFLISYKVKIFSSIDSVSLSQKQKIFIDDQWYPRIPVFRKGKWEIYPMSQFTKEFRSFADFNLNISAPLNYSFITSGNAEAEVKGNGLQHIKILQNRVTDFVILFTKDIKIPSTIYQLKNNTSTKLKLYIPQHYNGYFERTENAVSNSIRYLEKTIGNYPNNQLSILYLPNAVKFGYQSFSNVIIVSDKMYLADNSYNFEELIARKITEQYFHFTVANNSQTEAWLSAGISKYIAEKIKLKYYANSSAEFKFLKYVAVNGLQFLSYNGIPLIYTLGYYKIPQEALSLNDYYSGYKTGSISDSSYLFIDKNSYTINSVQKPFLMLLSLERITGKMNIKKILKEYYSRFKYRYPSNIEFYKIIGSNTKSSTLNYIKQVYNGFDYYDLKINKLKKIGFDKYEITFLSSGHCAFITDIFVYTNSDTLKFKWNTSKKWGIIRFSTDKKVLAAEIDPTRKYIFDSNYSNNSYTTTRMNWASISISIRWFFWIQNALMILGSAA